MTLPAFRMNTYLSGLSHFRLPTRLAQKSLFIAKTPSKMVHHKEGFHLQRYTCRIKYLNSMILSTIGDRRLSEVVVPKLSTDVDFRKVGSIENLPCLWYRLFFPVLAVSGCVQ